MASSLFFLLLFSSLPLSLSQSPDAPLGCNGVQLTYALTNLQMIRPFLPPSSTSQPYSFAATATILNSGTTDLLAWSYLISFSHRELLVSVDRGVLTSSSPFPFNTSSSPGGPTSFSGFPNPDLRTPIDTANDWNQIQTQLLLTGTLFAPSNASSSSSSPLPAALSLDDPNFLCPPPQLQFNTTTSISTCCVPNPNPNPNITSPNNNNTSDDTRGIFAARRSGGDISVLYDVLMVSQSSYTAQVTIHNESPHRARLDGWRLSWEWMREEFISSIRGAYTTVTDVSKCILGPQGQFYRDFDFSKVVNCDSRPTILDLPSSRADDADVVPFCCRGGTILPREMDASKTTSAFRMEVFKMPPDLNRTKLHPPQNFAIAGGTMNPSYRCGQPVRVAPTLYPDPTGLESSTSAVATWQVVCNVTRPQQGPAASPKCCVSFSAFYNDSVVPCRTCACGCSPAARRPQQTCNATAPSLLVPPQALLVPFDDRTDMVREHARLNGLGVPDTLPCGDNCGVSVNWHVNEDFRQGWTARVTLFNWGNVSLADWFAAVELDRAYEGYEAMYSFNGTAVGEKTIFMRGLPGLNYLVGEADGAKPGRNPRVPGKQQTLISFTKKTTPGIDVAAGDGFPTRFFFNGEECSMPDRIPTSRGTRRGAASGIFSFVLLLVATALGYSL